MQVWLWVLAGCSLLTGRGDLEADLEQLCSIATQLEADTSIDVSKRLNQLTKKAAGAKVGPAGLGMVRAAAKAPPKMRRKVVDEALGAYGIEDLDCPALRGILLGG